MPKINEPGQYLVKITNAEWKPCRNGMQAHITGENSQGNYATARISATETIIQSGPHKGKKLVDKAMDDLVLLGLPTQNGKPLPMELDAIIGRQAEFVMELREWTNDEGEEVTFCEVKYVNAVGGKPAATRDELASFFGGLGLAEGGPAIEEEPPF